MTNLIRSNFQSHPFHLVSPSPWPAKTSLSLFAITTSGVSSMQGFHVSSYIFIVSFMSVVICMSLWFRDIISEATYLGNHTAAVQRGLNMGVALFIVSEGLFFLAIFWTFFHSSLSPASEIGSQWPPNGIESINAFELPLLNTILLLASGFTITYAHHSVIHSDRTEALYGIALTVVLAIAFTCFQGLEYVVSSFTISDSVFGSCFYFGTGLMLGAPITFNMINNTNVKSNFTEPYWVTGFSDAESYFSVRVSKDASRLLGVKISPVYGIELHARDIKTLHTIRRFFKAGSVAIRVRKGRSTAIYAVQSIKDIITTIIPHFKKFPLITQKHADFLLFEQVINIINDKEHLTEQGIHRILSFKASMGKGLSTTLKDLFPNLLKITRPPVINQVIKSPFWLAGFIDGEGCFYLKVTKLNKVHINFSVSQHSRDSDLFNIIKNYLGCGIIEKVNTRPNEVRLVVYKINDLVSRVIPILDKKLITQKYLDFYYFKLVASLMLDKQHLTEQGLSKILEIKRLKKK